VKKDDVNKKPDAHEPRRILTKSRSGNPLDTDAVDLEKLLDKTIHVINKDIERLKGKVDRGALLDPKEGIRIRGYLESLVKVSRERRDAGKKDEERAAKLTNEELFSKAIKLLTPEQLKSVLEKEDKE